MFIGGCRVNEVKHLQSSFFNENRTERQNATSQPVFAQAGLRLFAQS